MLGISLITGGTVLEELSSSIGKIEMRKKVETPFTYGALTTGVCLLLFATMALVRPGAAVFSFSSLPTLSIRIALEIVQSVVTIYALKRADRSTLGFLRTLTIPLLLLVDVFLSYAIDGYQFLGISFIVIALLLLYMNHGLSKKGSWLSLISGVNATLTISLYKYDITHFNSPEIEQTIVLTVLFSFFLIMSLVRDRMNPFALLRRRACLAQAALLGVGATADAFSFLFAAPSILVAAKRTVSIFMSVLLGRTLFAEKHFALKLIAFGLCAAGFVLLVR